MLKEWWYFYKLLRWFQISVTHTYRNYTPRLYKTADVTETVAQLTKVCSHGYLKSGFYSFGESMLHENRSFKFPIPPLQTTVHIDKSGHLSGGKCGWLYREPRKTCCGLFRSGTKVTTSPGVFQAYRKCSRHHKNLDDLRDQPAYFDFKQLYLFSPCNNTFKALVEKQIHSTILYNI